MSGADTSSATPATGFVPVAALTTRRRRPRDGGWLIAAASLFPSAIFLGLFVLVPTGQALYLSLFDWNGLTPLTDFIGLKNYQVALASPEFRTAIFNNGLIIVLSLAIQIPFSLALAVMLNRRFRGRWLFRVLFFLPYVLSEAVTGVVFRLLLQPGAFVDSAMDAVGLGVGAAIDEGFREHRRRHLGVPPTGPPVEGPVDDAAHVDVGTVVGTDSSPARPGPHQCGSAPGPR